MVHLYQRWHGDILACAETSQMPERTFKIPIGSMELEVTEVGIKNRKDGIVEYELEDGCVIRIAIAPTQIMRVTGGYDSDGNPTYLVKHGTVINTISAPEHLRKK